MVQARCLFLTIPVAVAPRVNRGSRYAVRYSGTYRQLSLVSERPSRQTWGGLRWLHWLPTWRSQSERSQVTGKAGSKSPTSQGQPSVPLREKSRGCGFWLLLLQFQPGTGLLQSRPRGTLDGRKTFLSRREVRWAGCSRRFLPSVDGAPLAGCCIRSHLQLHLALSNLSFSLSS